MARNRLKGRRHSQNATGRNERFAENKVSVDGQFVAVESDAPHRVRQAAPKRPTVHQTKRAPHDAEPEETDEILRPTEEMRDVIRDAD